LDLSGDTFPKLGGRLTQVVELSECMKSYYANMTVREPLKHIGHRLETINKEGCLDILDSLSIVMSKAG